MDAHTLAQLTWELCHIASPTRYEAALTDHIEQRLQKNRSVKVTRIDNALVIQGPQRPGKPTLALLGHTDTVPASPNQPCLVNEQEGKVFGCGASDMKGGLAVMLALLDKVDDFRNINLKAIFYDREESAIEESGLEPLCAQGWLDGVSLGICLEPTDGNIEVGCVGSMTVEVTFTGQRAHSARPWLGKNAIDLALPFLQRVQSFGVRPVPIQGVVYREVMNTTLLQAGIASNVIPDRCTVSVNYRFAPHRTIDQAVASFLQMVPSNATYHIVGKTPAGAVHAEHPWVAAWQQRNQLTILPKQAWTDVARLGTYGIPAINFGPGNTAQAHQANEYASIDLMPKAYNALYDLLTHL